jgi:hypothetical protein
MGNYIEEKRAQIRDWVEASENIEERFGLEKALGYIVGEKLYHFILYADMIIESSDKEAYSSLLAEFAELIKTTYSPQEIQAYFAANPRLGPLGHTTTEEEHLLFVRTGVVKHSVETEVGDALVVGKMIELLRR